MEIINLKNAYKEVYVILNQLIEEDYNKIPKELINTIEENKNDEHQFVLKDGIELKDQDLLPETRAILYNLFKDYLSNPWQKEKILKWELEEKLREEKSLEDIYVNNNVFEHEEIKDDISKENDKLTLYKENVFMKMFKFIKKLINKD